MAGPSTSIALNQARKIEGYQLYELLGSGSFSQVYRAKRNDTGEILALKLFHTSIRTSAHSLEVAKEIAFLKILSHDNIIILKDYQIRELSTFIGTEFASLGNLAKYLEQETNTTDEAFIQNIMKQLLSALDYMHELGIMHGDIKPQNILCFQSKPSGLLIKICDFGLTEITLEDAPAAHNAGTCFFMAPEIVLRQVVDVRCDLWSAGVVMYVLMFRRNLFELRRGEDQRHYRYIRNRYKPNYHGFEKYSFECNSLVRGLLNYSKVSRPFKDTLRSHPFLQLSQPTVTKETFLQSARSNISSCFSNNTPERREEALVDGVQAIIQLKIYYNLIKDKHIKTFLQKKWAEYDEFTISTAKALHLKPPSFFEWPGAHLNDHKLREDLRPTPKLLEGFEIGCHAEMFLMEGNIDKALSKYKMALEVMLPLMKKEPNSKRKTILGRRIKQWVDEVESLTGGASGAVDQQPNTNS